jgi:hypothetical protein
LRLAAKTTRGGKKLEVNVRVMISISKHIGQDRAKEWTGIYLTLSEPWL